MDLRCPTAAQHDFLRAVRDYAEPDCGWVEVELQFLSRRTSDAYPDRLAAALCVRVAAALVAKGLLVVNPEGRSGPELTDLGRAFLERYP